MCAEWVKCADKEQHSTSNTNNNNSSSSNNWKKNAATLHCVPESFNRIETIVCVYNIYRSPCWYWKRAIFWYTYCFIHIFGGAVNKHIQSIGTRVRFYRLKLVLQCIHNDVICCCCCYCRLLLFPLWVIRHVGCSVALCVLGSVCACHYRMKIESISLIYCSCSCMHSFFLFSFLFTFAISFHCVSSFFAVFRFVFIFFYCTDSVWILFFPLTPRIDVGRWGEKNK